MLRERPPTTKRVYAVSENHEAPRIGLPAAQWAAAFVMHQTRRMLFMASSHVADSPFHADCLKLQKKLREAPGKCLSHSVLLKRMKKDVRSFREIVATLAQRGEIDVETSDTTGRAKTIYRLRDG